MRWRLSSLFLLTTIVAGFLALFAASWKSGHPNHPLFLGVYLLLLGAIVAVAIFGGRFRGAATGGAIFGAAYLICVLHGGFGLDTIGDAEWLARNTKIGIGLLGLSLLVSFAALKLSGANYGVDERPPSSN